MKKLHKLIHPAAVNSIKVCVCLIMSSLPITMAEEKNISLEVTDFSHLQVNFSCGYEHNKNVTGAVFSVQRDKYMCLHKTDEECYIEHKYRKICNMFCRESEDPKTLHFALMHDGTCNEPMNVGCIIIVMKEKLTKSIQLTPPNEYQRRTEAMVLRRPDLQRHELSQWLFDISGVYLAPQSIGKYLLRLGFTYRRLQIIAYQRSEELRSEYIRFASRFDRHQFLFIDVTRKDNTTSQRRYGYSKKGMVHSNYVIVEYVRRYRVSFMAGLDQTGIVGSFVVDNAFTGDLFNLAMETEILPYLGSFIHSEPRSAVVMDNCAIHNDQTTQLIKSKGAMAVFLPPYSPDMNLIEMACNQMKQLLKSNQDIANQNPKDAPVKAAENKSSENAYNFIHACGY